MMTPDEYDALPIGFYKALMIPDKNGCPRIIMGCIEGDRPEVTVYDAEGNPRIRLGLAHRTVNANNGEGTVTIEEPYVHVTGSGAHASITTDDRIASFTLKDDAGMFFADTEAHECVESEKSFQSRMNIEKEFEDGNDNLHGVQAHGR